jgi:hypothetical protein
LVRFEVVAVYCASATSKLIDPDWWGGLVLQRRAIDNRQIAIDGGAPTWLMDLLADEQFQSAVSKGAVLTEFVIGLGFLHRRTRLLAIWVAIPFHLAIEIAARVQVFSWAALAALVIWVTPTIERRRLIAPVGDRLAAVAHSLDWFGRFEIVQTHGGTVRVVEHEAGRTLVRHGADARSTVWSRLPPTFWFAAPMLAVARFRARRRR